MTSIPIPLFCNLDRYPIFRFHADQWGELGWVYDPHSDRYLYYTIDRKDQHDSILGEKTRAAFTAGVLPDADEPLRSWFASFVPFLRVEEAIVLYPDLDEVRRYSLGPMGTDAYQRPLQAVETQSAAALHAEAEPALQQWLEANRLAR
jgi:hypothetical protein